MGQIMRCPLVGTPCYRPITVQEKSFFLAESEQPLADRERRKTAIDTALEGNYTVASALDEKGINAFTCKICEMIQASAYCIADIKGKNANVLFELGMMVALGKPTIILAQKDEDMGLSLPSDLNAIEVVPFGEYIDIVKPLKDILPKLPVMPGIPSPIEDVESVRPEIADELRKAGTEILEDFRKAVVEAKLDSIVPREEARELPADISDRLQALAEKVEDISRLGLVGDVETVLLRASYLYNRERYEDALSAYDWCLELQPDDAAVLNNRGLIYHRMGRHGEALADYNRSLQLRPDDATALNNRGITYGEMGKYGEALADYDRNLALRPDYPSTLYNLACLFSLWEKKDDALAYLEKAIASDEKYREMARTDSDLDNVRDDPRFKKLVEPE